MGSGEFGTGGVHVRLPPFATAIASAVVLSLTPPAPVRATTGLTFGIQIRRRSGAAGDLWVADEQI